MSEINERRVVDVDPCPACGLNHLGLPFWRNLDSLGVTSHPEWIGMCLEEGEPVALVRDLEAKEKVVAIGNGHRKGLSI